MVLPWANPSVSEEFVEVFFCFDGGKREKRFQLQGAPLASP